MKNKVYIYKPFERFWHWAQVILIFILIFTGFEIHGTYEILGYRNAVQYHTLSGYIFLILILFAVIWHIITGEWRKYLPTIKNLKAQAFFYLFGFFSNQSHPTKASVLSKLCPFQKLVYLVLKLLVIPVMVASGFLYLIFRFPQKSSLLGISIDSIETIALFHTAGAFILLAFLIFHMYLITTGITTTSNLKAMILGYEEVEVKTVQVKKILIEEVVEEKSFTAVKEEVND